MGHEGSKDEDVVELNNEERPATKKRKLMLGNRATRTKSATKPVGGGTSTFTLEDNPVDVIIRDLEGVRSRIAQYELQIRQIGELVGNPQRESLIAAVQEAIQDPRRMRELERKVDHFTAEKRKATERVQKLEAEREKLLKQVKNTTLTVQNVSDAVDIEGNVWWKAKMFDAELENAGHVSGSKIVNFVMNKGRKMDASLKAMKALIASCMELFPATVESSKEEETSLSYSDLTPRDMMEIQGAVVGGGNQHVEEVEQVEDITAITAIEGLLISATEEVVPLATPVSTVGGEPLDGRHVAEVTPPSLNMAFQMVVRNPPPLAILAPGFSPDNQRSAPLAPDVAETADRVVVNSGPNGYEVLVRKHEQEGSQAEEAE
jgi:hypothetical protein